MDDILTYREKIEASIQMIHSIIVKNEELNKVKEEALQDPARD